jgi:hypothetical protein
MTPRRGVEVLTLSLGGALIVALVVACSGANEQTAAREAGFGGVEGETGVRDPAEDGRRCPRDAAYVEESLDTSGDNVADVRKVYRVEGEGAKAQKIILCRELDLDHDGRKDIFRFYNDEGRPLRELVDANFDGTIDSIAYFESGRMVKQEADRNGDGRADETRHYVQGKLMRVDRDDDHDGEVDVWEHWDQGELVRIGYDVNRDKVADFWHRAPPREGSEDRFVEPATDAVSDEDDGSDG